MNVLRNHDYSEPRIKYLYLFIYFSITALAARDANYRQKRLNARSNGHVNVSHNTLAAHVNFHN